MKKKNIQRIISWIICLSMMFTTIAFAEISTADTELEDPYKDPAIYMNDTFGSSQPLPDEEMTNASGWDVSGGGYVTGRNTYGGFWLVDTSTSESVTMQKKLSPVSGSAVKWEFTVKVESASISSLFYATLEDETGRIASFELNGGKLYCQTSGGKKSLGTYSANEVIKISSEINLTDGTIEVWRNGDAVGEVWKIASGRTVCYAKFTSGKSATGRINIIKSSLSSGYIINDCFDNETVNDSWTSSLNTKIEDGAVVLPSNSYTQKNVSGVPMEDEDSFAIEYRFKTDAFCDTELIALTGEAEPEAADTYLENILPDEYYNGDGDIGSGFAEEVDATGGADGNAAVKLSASKHWELFGYTIGQEELASLGDNLKLSYAIRKSADASITSVATGSTAETITGYRIYLTANYTAEDGTTGKKETVYSIANAFESDSEEWYYPSYVVSVSNALAKAPEGAVVTELRVSVRLNNGPNCTLSGNVWLDEISLNRTLDESFTESMLPEEFYACNTTAPASGYNGYKESVVETDPEFIHDGDASLRIQNVDSKGYNMIVKDIYNTTAGSNKQDYAISFWMKKNELVTENLVTLRLVTRLVNGGENVTFTQAVSIKDTTDWQRVSIPVTAEFEGLSENGGNVYLLWPWVGLGSGGAYTLPEDGCVWLDQIEMYKLPATRIKTNLNSVEYSDDTTDTVKLVFNTEFVDVSACMDNILRVNGEVVKGYTVAKDGNEITITLPESTNIAYVDIVGIKDIWGNDVDLSPVKSKIMSLSLDADGNITASDGTVVSEYLPNVWYNAKVIYRMADGEADIYINHMKKATVSVSSFDLAGVIFGNNSTASLTIDDVKVKKYIKPDNYVPEPNPVKTEYYTSILSCGLWTESGGRGWDTISGFDERSPVIGFYDEGNPEVSDWEIKYMVEHGINSQIFCWYDSDVSARNNSINAYKDAEYSDMLDYSIMWTNTGSQYVERRDTLENIFQNEYVPFWIEHYFKDPRYTKIDGKPVLYIFSGKELMTYLSGDAETADEQAAAVKEQLDYLNSECEKAGLGGVKVFVYNADDALMDTGSVAGKFTYGYMHKSADALATRYPQEERDTNIPILAVRQNQEAWDGPADVYTSPATFRELAKTLKNELLTDWDFTKMSSEGTKMLIIDNWNEYGEGHFIMPTKTFGFAYLDAFRDVFVGEDSHSDVIPDEEQLSRITKLYQQDRRRRSGSNVESDNKKGHIIKLWDFTDEEMSSGAVQYDDSSKISSVRVDNFRIEDGLLKGTVKETQSLICIEDFSMDIELSDIKAVYIKGNTYIDEGGVYFKTAVDDEKSWYNNFVDFEADWNKDIISEHVVYMDGDENWTGNLVSLYLRIPVTQGHEFMIESIGLVTEGLFTLGDDLVTNGSFEAGAEEYSVRNCSAEITHDDFNRGASALLVTGNGVVEQAISETASNASYTFECGAKLPYSDTGSGSLKAYLSYTADGVEKRSNELVLDKFYNKAFARLTGELHINESKPVSGLTLCIENTIYGESYLLDDISMRKINTQYTKENHITDDICDGILLSFEESIDISKAAAVCVETAEALTLEKIGENAVLIGLPKLSEGECTVVLSGAATTFGEALGVLAVNIYSGLEQESKVYYTNYGTESQQEISKEQFSGTVTGITNLINLSAGEISGNVIAAFYKDYELIDVCVKPFTAAGGASCSVQYEVDTPNEFTEYKEFVWDKNIKPLLKGGE
ncbi:MAG: glycoside hydrolase family 99-like domain-containing protein [Clostridia bacterium]|nr:glycoside hydrolase family 99-like domain-containing protein [Clostridia bacterium]